MMNQWSSVNDIQPFQRAERYVEDLLLSYGHRILKRNYEVHNLGEIDLLSLYEGTIYATEVKARQQSGRYEATETFLRSKQQRIYKTLYHYLRNQGQSDRPLGILAAEVYWDRNNRIREARIRPWEF